MNGDNLKWFLLGFELPKFQVEVGFWKHANNLKYNVLRSNERSQEIIGFYNHETNIFRIREDSLKVNNTEFSAYNNSVTGQICIKNSLSELMYFKEIINEMDFQLEDSINRAKEWILADSKKTEKYPFSFKMLVYLDFKSHIAYYSVFFPSISSQFVIKKNENSRFCLEIFPRFSEHSNLKIDLNRLIDIPWTKGVLNGLKEKLSNANQAIGSGMGSNESKINCPWFFSTVLVVLLFEEMNLNSWTSGELVQFVKRPNNETFSFNCRDCFISNKLNTNIFYRSERKVKEIIDEHILTIDLKLYLSPFEIQQKMNTINIDLIKWRLLPDFDKRHFINLKFLIIGSGTLGCSVSRNLIGWGIRNFTFIDNSTVSLSNPARQCLFTLDDAKQNKNKAKASVERLKYICPDLNAEGIDFEVPILGDPTINTEKFINSCTELKNQILDSDVVLLLTDNKESRWLPSVLIAVINRFYDRKRPILCVTVGLGFDSFIVVRNTFKEKDTLDSGCYFCGDFTINSKTSLFDIPVDQQCSVVRMGVGYFASSIAVELIMNLAQHPLNWDAPHSNSEKKTEDKSKKSLLGTTPRCIRGYLSNFSFLNDPIQRNKHCVACSQELIKYIYEDENRALSEFFNDPTRVESVSGLDSFKSQIENVISESDN
ncbi:Ubiquitin-like modifier-activating enzyme atg7 [Cryptosporidium felis]|nr:Ubiquitin-like modifier-activating enzyme atg7 [Cryptosporidium felis]